jgi:phosphoribosylamine--glycine ligase
MGLMFTAAGPKILEYNMRLGDPETQVLLPQIDNDFYDLIQNLLAGKQQNLRLNGQTYIGVVLTHPAYPAASKPALPVLVPTEQLLAGGEWIPAAVRNENGKLLSSGGRVLTLVAAGTTPQSARTAAYELVREYAGELAYRDDIGVHSLE